MNTHALDSTRPVHDTSGYVHVCTEIEQEQNGIFTYDRRAKFDNQRLARAFGAPAANETFGSGQGP